MSPIKDLNAYSDLEEHFKSFSEVADQHNEIGKENLNLKVLIDKLTQEIEILNKSEQGLTRQLETLSSRSENQDDLNRLYVELKEKYNELRNKYTRLEKEKSEQEKNFTSKENRIIEDYLKQIKTLEHRIEEQKKEFLEKENKYYNEVQTQEACADLRYDDMESKLQSLIRDTTQKLQESNRSCNTMREELLKFKTLNNTNMESGNKRIQELERELRVAQQQLLGSNNVHTCRSDTNPYSNLTVNSRSYNNQDKASTNVIKNRIVMYNDNPERSAIKTVKPSYVCTTTKYHSLADPININQEGSSSDEFVEVVTKNVNVPEQRSQNVHVQGGVSFPKEQKFSYSSSKSTVPPLRQISAVNPNKRSKAVKKRKLFDPNNLDYLEKMEQPE